MFQRTKLYESSLSMKVLLTGFIVAVCMAALMGLSAFLYACRNVDGDPAISFDDVEIFLRGADRSILEAAADAPKEWGLVSASEQDLARLTKWCQDGAPRSDMLEISRILTGSRFDLPGRRGFSSTPKSDRRLNRRYKRLLSLATRQEKLSPVQLTTGTAIYLAIMSLAFLGLGLMFVRTSLFEKTKVFFISATFIFAVACPTLLWLARRHTAYIYAMLLSALLLVVCLGVLALVALYDIWFRRPVT